MKYIIANWKMNMNLESITIWVAKFEELTIGKSFKNKMIVAAPFPYLPMIKSLAERAPVSCAAQDVSTLDKGAHTGEVGAFEIKDFCNYSIIGHSERAESIETVIQKRDMALANGVTPFVCFKDKANINNLKKEGAIIVWEDPANISKNGVYYEQDPKIVKETFKEMGEEHPGEIFLYGGSVNIHNVAELSTIEGLGGVLVGNASLDPEHFIKLALALE